MSLVRHSENRPGQDPQIFSSRSNSDFSNACDCLGKIQPWRAGGKNLNGSNQRTVFRRANPTNKSLNYLLHNPQTDNKQKPLTQCPFFRSKPSYHAVKSRSPILPAPTSHPAGCRKFPKIPEKPSRKFPRFAANICQTFFGN